MSKPLGVGCNKAEVSQVFVSSINIREKIPYFSDHKVHLKSLIFSKIKSVHYNAVRLMYESGCAFSFRTNCIYVVKANIYLIATNDFL